MVLSIASQKGGVGKATTSISLAAGLAHQDKHVLLVDIDSQANSSKVLVDDFPHLRADESIYVTIIDRKPLPVRPSIIPNLDVVPSHILLSNTDVKLTTAIDPLEARLKTQLDAIRAQYEQVIVDCPPAQRQYSQARPARAATACRCATEGKSAIGDRLDFHASHQLFCRYLTDIGQFHQKAQSPGVQNFNLIHQCREFSLLPVREALGTLLRGKFRTSLLRFERYDALLDIEQ